MDGVIADFVGGCKKLFGKQGLEVTHWHFYEDWGLTDIEFWSTISDAGTLFWSSLEPYPWFDDLIRTAEEIDPNFTIVTAPSQCVCSLSGKRQWLTRHLPQLGKGMDRVIMTNAKHRLANKQALLIDDSAANFEKFVEHNGRVILFGPMPWNRDHEYFQYRPALDPIDLLRWELGLDPLN